MVRPPFVHPPPTNGRISSRKYYIRARAVRRTMSTEKKSFIVTLKENASSEAFKDSLHKLGGEITHEYSLIKGFAVKIPEKVNISSLKSHDAVATVEEDQKVHTQSS